MIHILLHVAVPLGLAVTLYRKRWRHAFVVLIATMVIDIDHLLANPIYDPDRCSIGFHPGHTMPVILLYGAVFVWSVWKLAGRSATEGDKASRSVNLLHLISLGLLIHMMLDGLDCIW
ncbi:MAG: DUF6122 family protein [Rhodothermales bacterium]